VARARAPGRTREEIAEVRAAVAAMLRAGGGVPPAPWEELEAFLPVRAVPSRHACVLLPFDALGDALARVEV
jgi:NifU-like protein involved in Fe-S cluster formation